MKLIAWLSLVVAFLVGVCGGMAYIYNTFATTSYVDKNIGTTLKYVDDKHADAISHSDANRAAMFAEIKSQQSILSEIKDTVKTIETRTWESQGHKR
jgi:hypothetical protein